MCTAAHSHVHCCTRYHLYIHVYSGLFSLASMYIYIKGLVGGRGLGGVWVHNKSFNLLHQRNTCTRILNAIVYIYRGSPIKKKKSLVCTLYKRKLTKGVGRLYTEQ